MVIGQEYSVVSFEPALKDLTARTAATSRVDGNGRKCAVIKVYAHDGIAAVRGNVIGNIPATGMEKWIYLSHDSKDMEIVFNNHYPLYITFMDYDIPTVTGQMTYILKLKENDRATSTVSNLNHMLGTPNDIDGPNMLNQDKNELTLEEMVDRGYAAEQQSDYSEALKWYRKGAEQGFMKAQYRLGRMYYLGNGVSPDKQEANKWIKKAADQGYDIAQNALGFMYSGGIGIKQDQSEAVKWYRKAAEQGNADAQHNLGCKYEYGIGLEKDLHEAVKWFRMAAEQGHGMAQYSIGCMYENGKGLKKDVIEAVKWYRKAADQENSWAQFNLGLMYENGKGIKKDVYEAAKWYRKAAEQEYDKAQYCLGLMYENGRGTSKDLSEAKEWFEKAAAQGYKEAIDKLRSKSFRNIN